MSKVLLGVIVTLLAGTAYAGGTHVSQTQDQNQGQAQTQDQAQSQSASSAATSSLSEGDTAVSNSMSSENNSTFFAFGTSFPNSQGCFAGAQGGGGGSGGAGFLGFHYLDHNCWMDQLASQTRHVETKARLQCSAGKFRNAIAYDQPKGWKGRQTYCIQYMVGVYEAEIEDMKKYVDDAVAAGLLTVRQNERAACDEKVERCEAAVVK